MKTISLGCVQFNVFTHLSKGENCILRYLVVMGSLLGMIVSAAPVLAITMVAAVITAAIIDRESTDKGEVFQLSAISWPLADDDSSDKAWSHNAG